MFVSPFLPVILPLKTKDNVVTGLGLFAGTRKISAGKKQLKRSFFHFKKKVYRKPGKWRRFKKTR
jgi:hypothetical protein